MSRYIRYGVFAAFGIVLMSPPAEADLYEAATAVEKQDLPEAFRLYRELAELGHPLAQENIAAMYVNGEGVERDNALGYAWAKLALENGGGETARSIVQQLDPHLTAAARAKIAEMHARYGNRELERRLLPDEVPSGPKEPAATGCRMRSAPDPDRFYPPELKRREISGTVVVETRVLADGSAPLPRALYSFPPGGFDAAGRVIALGSTYSPAMEKGVAVPCTIRFKVKFNIKGGPAQFTGAKSDKMLADLKRAAAEGDPNSQLLYSLVMLVRPAPDPEPMTTSRWLLRAAQAGLPAAQYLIGERLMSRSGRRVQDAQKAERWFEMAGSRGSGEASIALAIYLLRSEHDAPTRLRGFTWMERAAASGHFEGRLFHAALLASWPDASRRDPLRALSVLDELGKEFDYDPLSFEIRAAALAAQGQYENAIVQQKRALAEAKRKGWNGTIQQRRLDLYEQGRFLEQELIRF
jgi:TPR repeat protein